MLLLVHTTRLGLAEPISAWSIGEAMNVSLKPPKSLAPTCKSVYSYFNKITSSPCPRSTLQAHTRCRPHPLSPRPKLVLSKPPMAPLRMPSVTDTSRPSPIASDGRRSQTCEGPLRALQREQTTRSSCKRLVSEVSVKSSQKEGCLAVSQR